MTEMIAIGDQFPTSKLALSGDRSLDLGALDGPAVLYFYPKDGTSTCTIQARQFNLAVPDYKAAGVTLVGVSVDDDESHRCFADDEGLQFPLLADPGGVLTKQVGLMKDYGDFGNLAERVTLLLDQNAVVRGVWSPQEQDLTDHPGQVLDAAKAL